MPGQPFSPETTLVAVLGASSWPLAPKLPPSEVFARSAVDLISYFTDPKLFGLPNDDFHLLNLFDDEHSPVEINRRLSAWLRKAQEAAPDAAGAAMRDLIIYYVGHGGFTPGGEQAYFLALRSTEANNEGISSLRMTDLARTVTREAKSLRRFLILDCCFAESAYELFQSEGGDPANAAHTKALMDFPARGTALLCSSSARDVSIAPKGENYTMFSGSLLEVLRAGDVSVESPLSLEHVARRVSRLIGEKYPDTAVRPKVSSPDEREGDIADLPLFPNAALLSRPMEQRVSYSEHVLERILEKLQAMDEVAKRIPALEEKIAVVEQRKEAFSPELLEKRATPAEELARQDRLLRRAPPWVQAEVRLFRQARINGLVWVLISAAVGFCALWPIGRQLFAGAAPPPWRFLIRSPFPWLVVIMATHSGFIYLRLEPGGGSATANPDSSKPALWETLPIVLAMRTGQLIPLFGSLRVPALWFDIGAAILVISLVSMIVASLAAASLQ